MTVRNILLSVRGESRDAQASLHEIANEIRRLPNTRTVAVRAEVDNARRRLAEMREQLNSIDRDKVSPEVSVQITDALLKLEVFDAKLAAIPEHKRVDIDVRRGILEDLLGVERGVGKIVGELGQASGPSKNFGQALGDVGQSLRAISPMVQGLGIAILVKLIPGLIGVAASALSAAGGIGVLATALAAAAGPALVLVVELFSRFAKVLEALKAQDQARTAAAHQSAAGNEAAANAARQRRDAENAVRDSLQAVTSAERAVTEARKNAADQLRAAVEAQDQAQRRVVESARDLKQSTLDAFRAMADAASAARDAVLQLADAQQSLAESRLGIAEAAQALRDFRTQAGLTGGVLDSIFKRFTDVDVAFDATKFAQALAPTGLGPSQMLQLERLVLNYRRALLSEKDAANGVAHAETTLARARQENARFQREGIAAFGPYRNAVLAVQDAQRALNDATRKARELERQGISNNPQVLSALDSLRNAEQRLTEARKRRVEIAAQAGITSQDAQAKALVEQLTGSERRLLGVLQAIRTEVQQALGPAVDAVFGGLVIALGRAGGLLTQLRGAFTELGQAWGDVLNNLSLELVKPEWVVALRFFTQQAAVLSRVVGNEVFINFLRIMRNIAIIALPLLVEVTRDLAGWLGRVADATGKTGRLSPIINVMVESFRVWARLGARLLDLMVAFAAVLGPFGDQIVSWLSDVIAGWAKWLRTAKGQKEIKRFFDDTIPTVKSILTLVGRLAVLFLRFFQAAGPILKPLIDALSFLVGVLSDVVGWIGKIPQPLRTAIGQFFLFTRVLRILQLLPRFIGFVITRLRGFGGAIITWFARPWIRAGQLAIRAISSLPGVLGRIASRAAAFFRERIIGGFRGLLAWLGRLPKRFFSIGVSVVTALWDGLKKIGGFLGRVVATVGRFAGKIRNHLLGIFRGIAEFVRGVFASVWGVLKSAINFLIRGVNWVIGKINAIPDIPTPFGDVGIPTIHKIPELAQGGLARRSTLARIGEGGREAVLPLTRSIFRELARAISRELRVASPIGVGGMAGSSPHALAVGAGTSIVVEKVELPPAPPAAVPDARYQAVQFAKELSRRGGS